MARKLRIAASVFFGLATVALCVLWVRSYFGRYNWHVYDEGRNNTGYLLSSYNGCVQWASYQFVVRTPLETPVKGSPALYYRIPSRRPLYWDQNEFGSIVTVPYNLIVFVTVAIAVIPWVSRFSLRTLFIATTLFAVVLGLAAWAAR